MRKLGAAERTQKVLRDPSTSTQWRRAKRSKKKMMTRFKAKARAVRWTWMKWKPSMSSWLVIQSRIFPNSISWKWKIQRQSIQFKSRNLKLRNRFWGEMAVRRPNPLAASQRFNLNLWATRAMPGVAKRRFRVEWSENQHPILHRSSKMATWMPNVN